MINYLESIIALKRRIFKVGVLLFILLWTSGLSFGKNGDSTKFKFTIDQLIQPGANPIYSYRIKKNKLVVLKDPQRRDDIVQ